jgi:SSS family solute:Na+ symporter
MILAAIVDFNSLYFSGVLFFVSVALDLIVSYATAEPDRERLTGLTHASIDRKAVRASWNRWDVAGTCVVLGLVLGLYLYFSFWV